MILGPHVLRVRKAAVDDSMGNPGTPGATTRYEGCGFYPRRSTEETGRESTVIVGMTALIPDVGAQIDETSEIEWDKQPGIWHAVEGVPGLWFFMDNDPAGLEVQTRYGKG